LRRSWTASSRGCCWTGTSARWGQSSLPSTAERVSSPVFDGDYALHVRVPRGTHTGIGWQWKFRNFGLAEPEEIYFRYYIYLGPLGGSTGFDKLPGISGTYGVAGWGGRPSHGDDGWSARMTSRNRGSDYVEPGYYCYHADQAGTYGDVWLWGSDAYLKRGQWHAIEVYGRMNNLGPDGRGYNDGILRGWVDGQLVFQKTNIRFRDVARLKIEAIWFNVYVGGTWSADHDMDVYFDNMVVARNYIGPKNDGNATPFVVVGPDQLLMPWEGPAVLGGYAGDDGRPDPPGALSVQWSCPNAPAAVTFADPFATDTTATFSASGLYTLRLSADDGELIGFDEMTVYVAVPGDANLDRLVDDADRDIWAANYKQLGDWAEGDFNRDGVVNGADYTLWADNYGFGAGGGAAAEAAAPSAIVLSADGPLVAAQPGPAAADDPQIDAGRQGRFVAASDPTDFQRLTLSPTYEPPLEPAQPAPAAEVIPPSQPSPSPARLERPDGADAPLDPGPASASGPDVLRAETPPRRARDSSPASAARPTPPVRAPLDEEPFDLLLEVDLEAGGAL